MLPMEFDERRSCVTGWGRDPRTEDGELLWPGQFPRKVVEDRKRRLGPYAASAASLFANDGTFLLPGVRVRCRYMPLLG